MPDCKIHLGKCIWKWEIGSKMVSDMPLGNAFWKEPKTKMEKSFPECVLIKPLLKAKSSQNCYEVRKMQ